MIFGGEDLVMCRDRSWHINNIIYNLHIYSSFKETMFKACVFFVSWAVTFVGYYKMPIDSTDTRFIGFVIFIYALSFFAEIVPYMDPTSNNLKKIFPSIIVVWATGMIVYGLVWVINEQLQITIDKLIIICLIPVIIYFIDLLLFYYFKPPQSKKLIESTVKKYFYNKEWSKK